MATTTKLRKKKALRRPKTGWVAIPTGDGFRKFQQIAHLDVETKEYGLMRMSLAFTAVNFLGIYRWLG